MKKDNTGKQCSKHATYSNDIGGTDNLNGVRVKITVTINALDIIAAPSISVTVISREELPLDMCPSGLYIIRIPSLCAGSSVDPRHDAPGYISFVSCEKSNNTQTTSEQRNFEWYKTNILLPFINLCRVK